MNILGVQLILLAFGCFMIYVLFLHWTKKNITNKLFAIWLVVWVIFLFFTLFPTLLAPIIKDLFIVRVMDLAMICAFMVITYLTIENNIKIKKYEEQLEKLIRLIAIKNSSK
jgi:hypothetical protein